MARLPIPAMDKQKASQFRILSTTQVSERSPLIEPEKPNMYARMPPIFTKKRDIEDDSEAASSL